MQESRQSIKSMRWEQQGERPINYLGAAGAETQSGRNRSCICSNTTRMKIPRCLWKNTGGKDPQRLTEVFCCHCFSSEVPSRTESLSEAHTKQRAAGVTVSLSWDSGPAPTGRYQRTKWRQSNREAAAGRRRHRSPALLQTKRAPRQLQHPRSSLSNFIRIVSRAHPAQADAAESRSSTEATAIQPVTKGGG